jgi:hypothetical protein
MPGNPRGMISVAEQRFPVRIRVAVAPEGLDQRYARITAWLDENCGLDGWAMTAPTRWRTFVSDPCEVLTARQ